MKQLKNMKETLVSATQAQLANLQNVDTKELGCAIDMIKDLSEAIYYCSIVKSMEEAQEEQKKQQQQYPQQQQQPAMMYFREMYPYPYYPERDQDRDHNRMYYPGGNSSSSTQSSNSSTGSSNRSGGNTNGGNYRNYQEFQYYPNPYEGKSPERRRTYMEVKHNGDKGAGMKELEQYVQELTSDIVEMMQEATAEERQLLARKLTVLSNKVQQA